jgi:hypothetical protein
VRRGDDIVVSEALLSVGGDGDGDERGELVGEDDREDD